MPRLYGRDLSRADIEALAGTPTQFAGVRLMTLDDGLERGNRMLEFRTGTGLIFTVMVDRALDIGGCEFKGQAIGWHSPAGFRSPAISDPEADGGLGWLRSFSGLLATCGLDHALAPVIEEAGHFNYPFRKTIAQPIHGRVGTTPARLTGYGEQWNGDDCTLWCEGLVQQATVFGENLHLTRRITCKMGTNTIEITDKVVNRGFSRTPHMMLYHFNVGHPLLGEGSRYLAPIGEVVWAGHVGEAYQRQGVGYQTLSGPKREFVEQVWEHDMTADSSGLVRVALVNDALGLGFQVTSSKDELPCQLEWQNLRSGMYCLGLEPSTHHVLGKPFALERDEMIWLGYGEERNYHISLSVLDGATEIAAAAKAIAGVCRQPLEDYPVPSGQFPKLSGRP
jgi:Domain of unknown function (DUF4432)